LTSHYRKTGLVLCIIHSIASSQSRELLSVNEAVAIALQKNPRVLTTLQEIEAADARILQAGRIPNPEVGLSWNETPFNFNIAEADEQDIGITQQIEFPTRRSKRIDVATQDKEIAHLQFERTKRLISAQVKKAYYDARLSQEIIESFDEQLRLLQDVQRLLTDRYRAGTADYLDVIRGKVEIARLNNDIVEVRRDLQVRRAQLNLLMGRDADHAIELTDSLFHRPVRVEEDSLIRTLLEQSTVLKIAQHKVIREDAAVSLATTNYLPDFSLGLFHQRRAEQPPFDANGFTGTTTSGLGIQFDISVPLWFWQEPKGQVQEATALREIAQVNGDQIARRVRSNILNALSAVKTVDSQITVFDQSLLNDAQDILATAIDQYQNNQIDLLNLLDVHRTVRETKVEYARALLNYAVALSDLEVAAELPSGE
jgi:cobalt-zinc-cadmium efflux system outer membrane protein